jgi:hypothetical protein
VKRRTLDIIFAGGGIVVAIVLAIVGFVVVGQASFARDYVKQELGAQKITFAAASALTDEEKTWKAGSQCLVDNAGKTLETGPQAECYAKYYIRLHMAESAKSAGFEGATYATLGPIRSDPTAQINSAKQAGDTTKAADLQKKLDAATSLRSTMQSGETLSGLLLTVYGFSVLGEAAGIAGWALYGVAAIMVVLSVAGFIHALVTPEEEIVFGGRVGTTAPVTA